MFQLQEQSEHISSWPHCRFSTDTEIRKRHSVTEQNIYNAVNVIQTIDEQRDVLRESVQQKSKETIHKIAKRKEKERKEEK